VKVGENSHVGPWTFLDGTAGLEIGDYVSIAAGVHIYTHHSMEWALTRGKLPYEKAPTQIRDCCYIGPQAVIGMGVTIGPHAVVGANAFVNKDVEPWTMVAGTPAKVVRRLNEYEDAEHLTSLLR